MVLLREVYAGDQRRSTISYIFFYIYISIMASNRSMTDIQKLAIIVLDKQQFFLK